MRFVDGIGRRGRRRDPIALLPMINVVFLLLIFFLLAATAAAPPPFALNLPEGPAELDAGGAKPLFIGANGTLAYGDARGEAVFADIAARGVSVPLELRADGAVPASEVAALLARLAGSGVVETRLVLERP